MPVVDGAEQSERGGKEHGNDRQKKEECASFGKIAVRDEDRIHAEERKGDCQEQQIDRNDRGKCRACGEGLPLRLHGEIDGTKAGDGQEACDE